MNVVQLVYEGLAGGVLRVALEYDRNLKRLGHKGIVITSFDLAEVRSFYKHEYYYKGKIVPIPSYVKPYVLGMLNQVYGYLPFPEKILNFIHRKLEHIDWVISHNLTPIRDAFYLARKFNAKVAVIIHNPTYPSSILSYISATLLGNIDNYSLRKSLEYLLEADLVLAIHNWNVKLVRELYGVKAEPVFLGCNPAPKIPEKRGSYILVPVRLSLGKKVHIIARAIAEADKNAKVVFAGAKHYTTPKVLRHIKETGLRNYKVLIDVPKDLFEKLFMAARMVVYGLSETDVLMPASYGAAVVCLKEKYAGDFLINGIHGFIIDSKDIPIDVYAKYIRILLNDERLAWRMGYEAWKEAWRHTWLHATQHLIKLLESL